MEPVSDERYASLFGKSQTVSTISDAFEFLTTSEDKTSQEYFAALPSVLRAYYASPSSDLNSFWIGAFETFAVDFDPDGLDLERTSEVFGVLDYGPEHVKLLIEMLQSIKRRFLLEDDPLYVASHSDRQLGQAILFAISGLQNILNSM